MEPTQKGANKKWLKWVIGTVLVMLIIGISIWFINYRNFLWTGSKQKGSGHTEGDTFMHYAGPILPMNVSENTDGITADRMLHYAFTVKESGEPDLRVTDTYTLANNTREDKELDVIYPFISSISNSTEYTPELMKDEKRLQTKMLLGDYTGGFTGAYGAEGPDNTTHNLAAINSWEGYQSLLENGKYFEMAQKEKIFTDQSVTVYTFQDVTYPEEYEAATLSIEFDLPQNGHVITYGMNGAGYEDGSSRHQYSYFVRHASGQKVIILGEPPAEYTVQGYENGACEKKLNSLTWKVSTKTMLLSEAVAECIADYGMQYADMVTASPLVTEDLIWRAVISMFDYTVLGNSPKDRYDWMRLDDLIAESYSMERVMYLKAQVMVPAGQSIIIESKFRKGSSYDFACSGPEENKGIRGYDMMTRLGSSLKFMELKASISLPQAYEIIRQNFGFDLINGKALVRLDPAQERYYLEIKRAQ